MLSPNVNAVVEQLAQAYSTVARVDAFAYAAMNSTIGKLSPDPGWLEPIRNELTLLSGAGARWQQRKPQIWSALMSQFHDHATLVSGVANVARDLGNDRGSWIELLTGLRESAARATEASKAAEREFADEVSNLNNVHTVLSSSVDKAWAELGQEHRRMVALAEQIGTLNERLSRMEADLTAGLISSGKSYVQSSVTIAYSVVSATAAVSVPYLTIAGLVFTFGKAAYDLISGDAEIEKTLTRIRGLSLEMSQGAQAAAMSKALIQLITGFDRSLAAVGRQLPTLAQMWSSQEALVKAAIHSIDAGADPRSIIDLVAIKPAAASWETLSDFAHRLLQAPAVGRPVLLTTAPHPEA